MSVLLDLGLRGVHQSARGLFRRTDGLLGRRPCPRAACAVFGSQSSACSAIRAESVGDTGAKRLTDGGALGGAGAGRESAAARPIPSAHNDGPKATSG